jgi:pyridoxal phosphate enzyme (YggS family)
MHSTLEQLNLIKNKVNDIINKKQLKTDPKIIVVTKTFPLDKIIPLLENGHIHYGENKIQEAEDKWTETKNHYKNLKLHMIGKLQTNKAKKAVKLFDYIHSLDNEKLAVKISHYQEELSKKIKLFIQVNLGNEKKKSGLMLNELNHFYNFCTKELSLKVIGLMCLPPIDSNSEEYFKLLKKTTEALNLNELSMGMSSDFEQAILNGSTYLRLGTMILGKRNPI